MIDNVQNVIQHNTKILHAHKKYHSIKFIASTVKKLKVKYRFVHLSYINQKNKVKYPTIHGKDTCLPETRVHVGVLHQAGLLS